MMKLSMIMILILTRNLNGDDHDGHIHIYMIDGEREENTVRGGGTIIGSYCFTSKCVLGW